MWRKQKKLLVWIYAEKKPKLVLSIYLNGLSSSESPKLIIDINMENVQRLSPDGRVKPQAYGGRKIFGLTV